MIVDNKGNDEMNIDRAVNKNRLRRLYLKKRKELKESEIKKYSGEICKRFFDLEKVSFFCSRKYLLFYSFRNEVITYDIINRLLIEDKEVFLPYVKKNKIELGIGRINHLSRDLIPGVYGIKEPVQKDDIPVEMMDVIVVPGLIFARNGYRIGYGGGFYDRLLAQAGENTFKVGLVYHDFLTDYLPVKDHDLPVDIIITEKEVLKIE